MKNKAYSNPGRKPMMYGGMATTPKKRVKKAEGQTVDKPMPTPKESTSEKMTSDDKLYNSLKNMATKSLLQIADKPGAEGMAARRVLRDRGMQGQMPQGDQEPAGMMYGGKAKK